MPSDPESWHEFFRWWWNNIGGGDYPLPYPGTPEEISDIVPPPFPPEDDDFPPPPSLDEGDDEDIEDYGDDSEDDYPRLGLNDFSQPPFQYPDSPLPKPGTGLFPKDDNLPPPARGFDNGTSSDENTISNENCAIPTVTSTVYPDWYTEAARLIPR